MEILKYDTVLLDLDFTIWSGCRHKFWAKSLTSFNRIAPNIIVDKNNDWIRLDDEVDIFLDVLKTNGINLGFVTKGGVLDTPYNDQPAVKCLKLFNILPYFNYCTHVIYKTENKSDYIQPKGKTLFIDDSPDVIKDIKTNTACDVINRDTFLSWKDLLTSNLQALIV